MHYGINNDKLSKSQADGYYAAKSHTHDQYITTYKTTIWQYETTNALQLTTYDSSLLKYKTSVQNVGVRMIQIMSQYIDMMIMDGTKIANQDKYQLGFCQSYYQLANSTGLSNVYVVIFKPVLV